MVIGAAIRAGARLGKKVTGKIKRKPVESSAVIGGTAGAAGLTMMEGKPANKNTPQVRKKLQDTLKRKKAREKKKGKKK